MDNYIAKAYLSDKGNEVKPGSEIMLTKEQAEHLGNKVELTGKKSSSLKDLTNSELKDIAYQNNLEGYSKLNKSELIKLIEQGE